MTTSSKLCLLALIFFCAALHVAGAVDSSYTYRVADDYDFTITLKDATKLFVHPDTGVRYHSGGKSLAVSANSSAANSNKNGFEYHYLTTIEVYDESQKKVSYSSSTKDSFSLSKIVSYPSNVTVTVLVELWRIDNGTSRKVIKFDDEVILSSQFTIKYRGDSGAPAMTISSGGQPVSEYLYANGQVKGLQMTTNNLPVTLVGSATDEGSGVDGTSWTYKVGSASAVSGNQVAITETDGVYDITFQVKDRMGNSNSRLVRVTQDKTPPKVAFSSNPTGEWTTGTAITLYASASDNVAGVNENTWQYSTNGGSTWSAEGTTKQFSITQEGRAEVSFKVKDKAGNAGLGSITRGIDKTPPAVEIKGATGDAWIATSSQSLAIKATDALSGMASLEYAHTSSVYTKLDAFQANISIAREGRNTVTIRARDIAGNQTLTYAYVNIDTTPPDYWFYLTNSAYREGSGWVIPVYAYMSSDVGSGIDYDSLKYSLDGGAWTKVAVAPQDYAVYFSISKTSLSAGNHVLKMALADKAGNVNEQAQDVYVDVTPPVVSGGSLMGTAANNAPWTNTDRFAYVVTETETGVRSRGITINTMLANGYKSPFTGYTDNGKEIVFNAAAPDGTYQISIKATDYANNVSEEKTFYCRMDRTPPVISTTTIKSASRSVTVLGTDALSGLNYSACWTSTVAGVASAAGYTINFSDGVYEKEFTLKDIAGNSATKKVSFYIDQNPPGLVISAPAYGNNEKLPVSVSISSSILAISDVWHLIDGVKTTLGRANWSSVAIPLGSLAEGVHDLRFGAVNEVGVSGESASIQFIVDRTAPELKGYELRDASDPERVISEDDYTPGSGVLAKVIGEDTYVSGAQKKPGLIKSYSWAITRKPQDTPNFSSDRQSRSNEFTAVNFNEGINYLCIQAEDEAGNVSRTLKIPVLQDQSSPGAPVIKSSTHAEANRAEQAGFLSRAEFGFSPAFGMKSGVKGYQWRIEKIYVRNGNALAPVMVMEGEAPEVDQEGKGSLSVDLADNDEDEFYQALARCVGGNGKAGAWAAYRFRIDSEAPSGLIVQAIPQADGSLWHNQWETLVRWNKPSDMTGVAEYRHILLDEDERLASPLEERDTSSWSKTADTQVKADLRSVPGIKKSGKLRIGVSAVDYAGNSKLGQFSFGYDFVPPRFNQGALVISDAEDAMGSGKRIRWGGARDEESGPDRVVILVSSGDTVNSFVVGPELTEYVVSPLGENSAYTVVVRAYDRAGNQAELYDVCATGSAAIPSVYFIPYFETINGYDVSGKRRVEPGGISFEDITLQIPGSLELFAIGDNKGVTIRSPVEEIALGTISGSNGVFEAGESDSGAYELRSGGFALEAAAVRFSRAGGLGLENAAYKRPVIVSGVKQERTVMLGYVNAGNPPLVQFSSGSAAIGAEARIESVYAESGGVPGEDRNGFALTGVDSLFLSDGREWLNGAGISFDRKALADMAIRLGDASDAVPLRNSAMEAGSRNLAALLDISEQKPLTLAMGDAVYRVNKAGIRGDLLDIYEAALSLPEGYEPSELTVRNITIDTNTKTVLQGPDFFAENISVIGPGGAVFEGTSIRLDAEGNLLVTGAIGTEAYGVFRAEDILLSGNGIDWDSGAEIKGFVAEVYGFSISTQKARVTTAGILIPEGKIDIWGNQQMIAGLGLRADRKDAVWQDGIIAGTFSGDPGYGSALQMSGGRVVDGGVFAVAVLPLGDSIVDVSGAKEWTLPDARLYPNVSVSGSFAGEKKLLVANIPVRAENCFFDEQGLRIGKAWVEHIPNLSPETIAFTGMAIGFRGISVEGVSENKFLYSASGWEIGYASLGFDGQGIKGRGALALPEKLGGFALAFPETRITVEGLFHSGRPDETREILRFCGLSVFADGVALKVLEGAHVLELASPRLSLQQVKGPDIFFGKTIFDSDGKVLLGDAETRGIDFVSFNGYRIGMENARIDDGGFSLGGTLSLELFGKSIAIPGGTFRILPDLSVIGTGADAELAYVFDNWSVIGKGLIFDADRIRIGSNRVLFREIEFDIGEIPLYPDGKLLQEVITKQEISVSLFGAGAKISETRFSGGGIEASVLITLPSALGGKSFSFDRVGFKADGGFWVEKKVAAFSFAALGFSFAMEELTLDSLGLWAAKTTITLPQSMESVSFTVHDLNISSAGGVSIGKTEVSPFALWNMNFNLNNFSIVDGEASFRGTVGLPPALPGELSGREIQIQDFRASLGGGITAMDICLEGEYAVPFGDAWNLLFNTVRISYAEGQPWVSAERTELLFPQEYGVKSAYIDQAKFNPLNGKFVFSEIAFSAEIPMNFWGVEFTLNKLKIDSNFSLEFGGSARFPDSGLPAFLAGKTAAFNRFEIKADGTLGEVDVKLEGLEGAIIPGFDSLVLKKGSVALLKEGAKSLVLSIGGNISLDKSMPAGLAGTALKIETFTYDTASRQIMRLKATVALPAATALGNAFTKLSIGIDWNEAKQTGLLNLGGNLVFPASFPAFLAGKEAKISNFKIGFDGVVQSFTAKYATEKNKAYDAFGFLQLSDVAIEASLKSGVMKFDLDGTVILPAEKFPQGIGGTRAAVAMEFDTLSGLKTASASASMPNTKLFGSLDIRNGVIGISKPAERALEISVGGSLVLPSSFPAGLRGIVVGIQKLTINTSGEILDVDIAASGLGAKIFGTAELSNGSVSFKKGAQGEFLVNVGGSVRLVASGLPESVKKATLEIRALELSTKDGLRSFDVGTSGEIAFSVLGGVGITVSSLSLGEAGISMAASAKLPANYPEGLANTQFVLSVFKMGWNGALLDIQGGIKAWTMTIAGFTAKIDELYFDKDTAGKFFVSLKSCKIQIPENFGSFGGQYVAVKNAKFSSSDGSFLGDIEVSKIETEILGFKLTLDKPSISFSEQLLNFSKATLKLPEFLGKGEIALKKVTLSSEAGFKVSGGAFKLPSFDVGLFAFNNVKVDFSLTKSQYALEGSGSVVIPGVGNISASVGFTTKSATYPIGLKRAEFSYAASLGGIPLGATGLFVNGITGGISYGPPTELPSIAQGLFNAQGPRMKVGLRVGDSRGGAIIDMAPTTWVDIHDGAWAFEGRAAVLKGTLNLTADIIAALGDKGFVGQFNVDIKFARGGVTVYVFNKAGDTIMSGEGKVEFGIPKGFIIDTWLVKIPLSNLWIAKVNAAFGKFTNGKTGIKGTVDVPILGTIGAFVGSGGLDLGSLSSYKIEKPDWIKSIRFFDNDNINSYDNRDSSGNMDVSYQFFVPPRGADIAAPLSLLHEAYGDSEAIPGSALDRLIIVLEYPDGAPDITITSPAGIEYREGYEGCEALVEANGIVLVVHSAEAGIWQLRVRGLEEDAYQLSALGSMAMPLLELAEPSLQQEKTLGDVKVRGRTERGIKEVRVFAGESKELPGFDLGSCAVDEEGQFDAVVSVADLRDGEYFIYAELDGPGAEFSPTAYAPGNIILDRSDLPMLAPLTRVAETNAGILSLRWENTNDGRSEGYNVKIMDHDEDTESIVYAGDIDSLDFPGYASGQEVSFQVAALDNERRAGPWSEPVSIRSGQEKPRVNRPVASSRRVYAKGFSGGFIEGVMRANIADFQVRSDSAGYVGVRYAGPSPEQELNLFFGSPALLTEKSVGIPWRMGIAESTGPGLYEYPCEFFNEANGALNSPFVLVVEVSWPTPEVGWTDPGEMSGINEIVLEAHGNGFVPGTRVFRKDEELVILESGLGSMRVNVPPRFSASRPQRSSEEQEEFFILGPGGDRVVFPVTVLLPSYEIDLYARVAEMASGGGADYALAVKSLNGFAGNLSFRVVEKPEELEIVLPEFSLKRGTGATGVITVRAGKDARPGSHSVVIEGVGGKLFELVAIVRSEPPVPALSSVVPRAAYTGDTVHVYGSGLGQEGKLFINGLETPVASWSEGEIVFVVPADALGGDMQALVDETMSNALSFAVKDRGFELRVSTDVLEIRAGEETRLPLVVTGHTDAIALGLVCEPGAPFAATLSGTELKPGEPAYLTVKADAFAGNGSWGLVVHGSNRGFEASVEIRVIIGSSLRIVTARLQDALVDVSYRAELASRNAKGALEYRLARGDFPPGLSMTARGVISGRPAEKGRYQMDIEARDSLGWKDKRSFTITVWEETWGQAGKDGGNSRSANTDLSALKDSAWIYSGKGPVTELLGAEDRIIARGRQNLFALNAGDGSLSWSLEGSYATMLYAGAKLYALATGGRLEIRDPRSGVLLWTREHIEAISSDGTTVLEETADRRFFRNAERGTLIEEQAKGNKTILPVLWQFGSAYGIQGRTLLPLYGPGKAWDAGERILAAAADIRGGVAATEKSLILFDRAMTEQGRIAAAHSPGVSLSLTEDGVSVLDGVQLRSYDRADLRLQWTRRTGGGAAPGNGSLLANGVEKTVVAGRDGLAVLNRYTGGLIWQDEKPYAALALYHEKILASDAEGAIAAFSGPPNVVGPVTELRSDPPSPGESLWHTQRPMVEIISVDRETYTARTVMRHNGSLWADAPASFMPEDGEHSIVVYGVDSRGLAGGEARLQFRVDTGLPESDFELQPSEPESGWHKGPVTLVIDAWDNVSGIDWIWTSSSAYTGPMIFATQGIHRFSWQALDRAGNREELRELEIRIDMEPPLAEAQAAYDLGVAELSITASDLLSGVAFIEYRINKGAVERYGEPLLFVEPGTHRVRYRAFDRAGNGSDWQACEVFIPPDNTGTVLIDEPLLNDIPRKVESRARNGMPLVSNGEEQDFSRGDDQGAMTNLPSYVLGAEYIRWDSEDALLDESASIRFRVKRNTALYLFLPHTVPAPRGWSPVEGRAAINRLYYPGGAAVYMKRYGAGAPVELPGTPAGVALPLVMAQEKGEVAAEILIRREDPEEALVLEALVRPWQHSRRLPLRKRWFFNSGEGWEALEGNRYREADPSERPPEEDSVAAPLRFRLELYTPDGEVEYRVEKVWEGEMEP
jgi:hypothetical protein